MNQHSLSLSLRLVFLVKLLSSVTALDITYPKIGTVYPAEGPDDVQWQTTDIDDPSDLAIYLATYSGQNLTSQQACIVAATSDGSTAITLSHPAPHGDSWTWMFYDDDVSIDLGYNYVAESIHFQFQTTTPTPTPSPTPSASSSSISPAIAAAIGVGGTVILLALILFIGYCCFYRRLQRRKKRETISAVPYTPDHPYKSELDSKPGTSHGSFSPNDTIPIPRADVKLATHHEMDVYMNTGTVAVSSPSVASPGGELSVMARHSRLMPQHASSPVESPVSPVRHEMYHDLHRDFHELPSN